MTTIGATTAAPPRRVRASAPAKILLFGEHAVVYGCPSVATALTDIRLSVTIDRIEEDATNGVTLIFQDIPSHDLGSRGPLRRSFSWATIRSLAVDCPTHTHDTRTPSTHVLKRIDEILEDEIPEHAKTLRPAIYLCYSVLHDSPVLDGSYGSLIINVSAENFPIGAGLGSSAAFSVAFAGALMPFLICKLDAKKPEILKRINDFAFSSEVILHGSPSGVDNTISTFGGALVFRKLPTASFEGIEGDLTRYRFLVVNTRVPRSTKEQVANVRKLYNSNPQGIQAQFDQIAGIVDDFTSRLGLHDLAEKTLGGHMEANHAILNSLGVGHPQLDLVAELCQHHGIWTKLTGAGGGGCTVSLIPSGLDQSRVAALIQELTSHGFECFVSTIGGPGCIIEEMIGSDALPSN